MVSGFTEAMAHAPGRPLMRPATVSLSGQAVDFMERCAAEFRFYRDLRPVPLRGSPLLRPATVPLSGPAVDFMGRCAAEFRFYRDLRPVSQQGGVRSCHRVPLGPGS